MINPFRKTNALKQRVLMAEYDTGIKYSHCTVHAVDCYDIFFFILGPYFISSMHYRMLQGIDNRYKAF